MRKNRKIAITEIGLAVVPVTLMSVGFASFSWSEVLGNPNANVTVDFGGITSSSLSINSLAYTQKITFDWNEVNVSTMQFVFNGAINNYQTDWTEIAINLQVDEAHRDAYYKLLDEGLIVEPTFYNLTKENAMYANSEGTYYTSGTNDSTTTTRRFILDYKFTFGSFFNFMHPLEFFTSNSSNNVKKGSDYSKTEMNKIYSMFKDIDGAQYTLYFETVDSNNNYTVVLNANGGVFDSTGEATRTYSNLTYHSILKLPTSNRDGYRFRHWATTDGSTYSGSSRLYVNEVFTQGSQTSITLNAEYTYLLTSLKVNFVTGDGLMTPIVDVTVFSSSSSTTHTSTNGSSLDISLNIGDRLRLTRSINVASVVTTGLSGPDILGYYVVSAQNPTMTITPMEGEDVIVIESVEITSNPTNRVSSANSIKQYTLTATLKDMDGNTVTDYSNIKFNWEETGTNTGGTFSNKNSNPISYTTPANSNESNDKIYSVTCTITQTIPNNDDNVVSSNTLEFTATKKENVCFEKGTLIKTIRGQVPVEELNENDLILSYNHINGKYEYKKIAFLINHGKDLYDVIKLTFDDGSTIGIIKEHGLFSLLENKYVEISDKNYSSFVGQKFIKKYGMKPVIIKLISATIEQKITESYSIIASENINCVANGISNVNSSVPPLFNVFNYDKNHNYDKEEMARDFNKYGLTEYEEVSQYVSYKMYVDFNFKNFAVACGKGKFSKELMYEYFYWIRNFIENNEVKILNQDNYNTSENIDKINL